MTKMRFNWWCQKVLPLVYDESLSYYEVLCKLTDMVKELAAGESDLEETFAQFQQRQDSLENQFTEIVQQWADYKASMDEDFSNWEQQIQAELTEMANTLEAIKNGDYVDLYLDSIKAYIDGNLQNMVAGIVDFVSFGITADGYFAAYIPANWDNLQFDTPMDPENGLYGHLIMRY